MGGPKPSKCTMPNCEKPHRSRGLCVTHLYQALKSKDGAKKEAALKYLRPPRPRGKAEPKPPAREGGPVTLGDVEGQADRATGRRSPLTQAERDDFAPKSPRPKKGRRPTPGTRPKIKHVPAGEGPRTRLTPPGAKKPRRQSKSKAVSLKTETTALENVAVALELATWVGLMWYVMPDGFLVVDRKSDRKVFLDSKGVLHEATLEIGKEIHGGQAGIGA